MSSPCAQLELVLASGVAEVGLWGEGEGVVSKETHPHTHSLLIEDLSTIIRSEGDAVVEVNSSLCGGGGGGGGAHYQCTLLQ